MKDLSRFLPTPEMQAEFEKYKSLQTEEERAVFQEQRAQRIEALPTAEREAYIKASKQGLKAAVESAEELLLTHQLGDVANAISLSYIAKNYFGKSKAWLYQRLNGYKINGKPAQLSDEERKKFSEALQDLSRRINETALKFA